MNDAAFEMKFQAKMLERAAKKSEKEAQQQVKKAKEALKKGNVEGAKLYLQNANMKSRENTNNIKMAHRMDAATTQMKTNENNIAMVNQMSKITPLIQQQASISSVSKVADTYSQFNNAMDKLNIAGNIMNEKMDMGMMDPSMDMNVEKMLTDLKLEVNADINKDFMGINKNFQYQNIPTAQKTQKNTTQNAFN